MTLRIAYQAQDDPHDDIAAAAGDRAAPPPDALWLMGDPDDEPRPRPVWPLWLLIAGGLALFWGAWFVLLDDLL